MSALDTLRLAVFGSPPTSGHQPSREGVVAAFGEVVEAITVLTGGIVGSTASVAETLFDLNADLAFDDGVLGLVYNDNDIDNNGIYIKAGATGIGLWVATGLLARGPGPTDEQLAIAYNTIYDDLAAQTIASEAAAAISAAQAEAAAAEAALSAASAAGLANGMYETTAAGLAATADGGYFAVAGDGDNTYAILYRDVAGVAVEIAQFASRSAFDLPAANGTGDAAVMNAAITLANSIGGAIVQGKPGALYEIEEPVLMRSNVTLDLTGCTAKNIMSVGERMFSNAAMLAVGVSCTIAWTAGFQATVTQTAHGYARGDYVWFRGAVQPQYRGTFRIIEILTANTYVIQLMRVPTTTATGTITAVTADVNFAFLGADLDYDYPNTGVGAGYETFATYFAGAANIQVRTYRLKDCLKVGLCVAAVHGAVIDTAHFATVGDGVKVYGPAFGVSISNIFGTTGDDFVSVHPREYAIFDPNYQISNGDVIGVTLSNIAGCSTAGKKFTMYATDSGPIIDGISGDGFHGGTAVGSAGAVIAAHCHAPEGNGIIRSCILTNITANGGRIFDALNCQIERVELGMAGCRPHDNASRFVRIDDVSVVKTMVVRGFTESVGLTTAHFIDLEGRIDHLVIDTLACTVPNYFLTNTVDDATLGKVTITNSKLSSGAAPLIRFANVLTNSPKISIHNSPITALNILQTNNAASLDIENSELTMGSYVVDALHPPSGNIAVRLSTRNATKIGGGWLSGFADAQIEVFSADVEGSVAWAEIKRVDGGFMRNTNTAAGTITEAGIVDCIGIAANSWRLRGDPAVQRY